MKLFVLDFERSFWYRGVGHNGRVLSKRFEASKRLSQGENLKFKKIKPSQNSAIE